MIDETECWQAVLDRDSTQDEKFLYGVLTSGVFTFEAIGPSCIAILHTSFLETLLPAITARNFGGDRPRMSVWTAGFGMGGGRCCGTLVSALVIARAFSGTSRAASPLVAHHQR